MPNAEAHPLELLADRCEREEASRQLDMTIWTTIGLTIAEEAHCSSWGRMDGRTDLTRARYIAAWAKPYTTSLDAAVTLVPDELSWYIGKTRLSCMSNIYIPDSTTEVARADVPSSKSAAIVLCAAALRARAAIAKATSDAVISGGTE